mmetsp:Transcript_11004/g.19934  ORF Transcript_11004/g.19934 Transcript_11004/m.19934 type:complete len:210 (+) Transcript_11004:226-855(+)
MRKSCPFMMMSSTAPPSNFWLYLRTRNRPSTLSSLCTIATGRCFQPSLTACSVTNRGKGAARPRLLTAFAVSMNPTGGLWDSRCMGLMRIPLPLPPFSHIFKLAIGVCCGSRRCTVPSPSCSHGVNSPRSCSDWPSASGTMKIIDMMSSAGIDVAGSMGSAAASPGAAAGSPRSRFSNCPRTSCAALPGAFLVDGGNEELTAFCAIGGG